MINKYILHNLLLLSLIIPTILWANGLVEATQGLRYKILTSGSGIIAAPGKIATIHFSMWQDHNGEKGKKLFDTHDEREPLSFKIGTKSFIQGLNIGVNGMRAGEIRKLYVPAHLNLEKTSGKFPGHADLIFEVELLEIR